MRLSQNTLNRVTWNADFLAVPGKDVLKIFRRLVNQVFGIVLDFLDGPIPNTREHPKPLIEP